MGGNAIIEGFSTTGIDSEDFGKIDIKTGIQMILVNISSKFSKMNGLLLWECDFQKLFSGSSLHLMTLSPQTYFKYKNNCGDIDVMFDKSNFQQLLQVLNVLTENFSHLPAKDKDLLAFKVSSTQIITIWNVVDGSGTSRKQIQIDFEAVEFENGEPTEWARFSHSQSLLDFKAGVKGVYHKLLLRACTSPSVSTINLANGTSVTESMLAFSADYGLRDKFSFDKNKIATRLKPSESVWIKDHRLIISKLFKYYDKNASIQSFVEICEIIKQQDELTRQQIFNGFKRILLGRGAQMLFRDTLLDKTSKTEIVERLSRLINVENDLTISEVDEYYGAK
jgi:hypothetical protein